MRVAGGRQQFAYEGQTFEDGCLVKTVSLKGLRWGDDVTPSLPELERFKVGTGTPNLTLTLTKTKTLTQTLTHPNPNPPLTLTQPNPNPYPSPDPSPSPNLALT